MRFIQCKKCFNLINDWCEKVMDSPHPELTRDCDYYRALTNGDVARRMPDEKFASFLAMIGDGICPNAMCEQKHYPSCIKCWQEWLKKEAKL